MAARGGRGRRDQVPLRSRPRTAHPPGNGRRGLSRQARGHGRTPAPLPRVGVLVVTQAFLGIGGRQSVGTPLSKIPTVHIHTLGSKILKMIPDVIICKVTVCNKLPLLGVFLASTAPALYVAVDSNIMALPINIEGVELPKSFQ